MPAEKRPGPPRRTITRGRRLLQLVEVWFDQQVQRARAAVARGVAAFLVLLALSVFGAALLAVAAARLVAGLSGALAAAWDGAPWTGDLAVGVLLPALLVAALVIRRRARRPRNTHR